MTTTKEFVRTSWWVVTAVLVAAFYVWGGIYNLLEDGQPYVDQVPVLGALAVAIVIAIFLRGSRPRAAAGLIAVASAPAALIFWFPLVMALALVTIVGAVLDLIGRFAESTAGPRAAIAVVMGGLAVVFPAALGVGGLAASAVLLAVAAVLVLMARRPRVSI